MKIENLVFGCRIFVDDLNDAHKRCSAVHDRSRAAKHFDALNVAEIQGRERRVECASPWHSINYQEESIEFLQAPEVRLAGPASPPGAISAPIALASVPRKSCAPWALSSSPGKTSIAPGTSCGSSGSRVAVTSML